MPVPLSPARAAGLSLLHLVGALVLVFPLVGAATAAAAWAGIAVGPSLLHGVALAVCAAAGARWARALGRPLAPAVPAARLALGGALGYGLGAPAALAGLAAAEGTLLERAQGGGAVPMHWAFAALFTLAIGGVVLSAAAGLAVALGAGRRGVGAAARAAAAGALAFAAVTLAFDLAGWRVGAPGAEARFTMLVVLGAGLATATLAGGAALGAALRAALAPALSRVGRAPAPAWSSSAERRSSGRRRSRSAPWAPACRGGRASARGRSGT